MSMWRVVWHLLRWKVGLIPLVPLCGFLTVQYRDPVTWLIVLGIGGMLLARESHSYRALRILPLASKDYAAAFWYVTMGAVVVLFPLGGLLAVAMRSMSIYDLGSLVMVWAIVTSAFGLMLTLSANPLLLTFVCATVRPRQPYPSASVAFVAWVGMIVVCVMLVSMPERATEPNAAWMPLNSLCLLLAPTLVVATYHWREKLFAAALYPATAPSHAFRLPNLPREITTYAAIRAQGFGYAYLRLARDAVVWIAYSAVLALVFILPPVFYSGRPFNLRHDLVLALGSMVATGFFCPMFCVATLAPLHTLRALPLSPRLLAMRILGYFIVPLGPVFLLVVAPAAWLVGERVDVLTLSLMYVSSGIFSLGISSFFGWLFTLRIVPPAFLAQLIVFIGVSSGSIKWTEDPVAAAIAMSIIYLIVGLALLHHAIARSSRPYRNARREEGV